MTYDQTFLVESSDSQTMYRANNRKPEKEYKKLQD